MSAVKTLGINYPALADGVCPTLHPYLEEYEAAHEEQGRVVIYLEE
jgi:hypothetical protein